MSNTFKSFCLRVLRVPIIALSLLLAWSAGALSQVNTQTKQPTAKDAKPELVLQTGYNSFFGATRLVFSPDARLLATTTWRSGTIKLWETSTGRELRNLSIGGTNGMTLSPLLTFSSDGRWLASTTTNSIKVWDVISGREVQTLTAAAQISMASAFGYSFVGFSADSRKLVAISDAIRIWDTSTWTQVKSIEFSTLNGAMANGVTGVALRPDGNQIAFTSLDGEKTQIQLFDLTSGTQSRSIKIDHREGSLQLSFTSDGRLVAAGITQKKLKFWDLTGKENQRDLGPTTNDYSVIAFSGDGRVVSLSEGYTVKLWDTTAGRELASLNVANTGVFTDRGAVFVGLNADGKKAATGGFGTRIFLWDTDTGKQIQEFKGRSNWAYSVAFSADGNELSVGGRTRWDLRNGRGLRLLPSPSERQFAMPSRDGKFVATFAPNSNTITVLEATTGRILQTLVGTPNAGIERARFSPDGKLIAAFSLADTPTLPSRTSNEVKIWETSSGREVQTLNVGMTPSDIAFSDDGQSLVTIQSPGEVSMWNVASGTKARTLKSSPMSNIGNLANMRNPGQMPNMADLTSMMNDMIGSVAAGTMGRTVTQTAFSPDGRIVATAGTETKSNFDANAIMNNARNQKPSKNKNPNDYMKDVKFEVTGQVAFWDATTGSEAGAIKGHGKGVTSVVFSRDGKRIATGSTDNTIKIWDASSKTELRTLVGHTSNIESMDFSPDGKLLASASEDGGTILWDAENGEQLLTLVSLDDGGEWMVVTPQGLFDGTPQSWNQILWRYNSDTFNVAPVELYFNEFYHPGLLSDIFAGKRPKPAQDITKKDRRQPALKLTANGDPSARLLKVTVDVTEAPGDSTNASGSGAQDVRLFRNGSLVKVWRGDVLKGQRSVTLEMTIPIVAGENKLTAYAFNRDNIKSSDAELIVKGADSLKRQGTAYVLAVGVNNYANAQYNLKYAVADAEDFAAEVKRQQEPLKRYAAIEIVSLSNEQATKANIVQKVTELATKVQPEDAVIVFFAGHGTAQGNQFYLIPHDLGYDGPRENLTEAGLQTILTHSVSDRELEKLFEGIDAGQLLLVIDACNSGQALEAEEKRRGPMNSKGLAQLAYEKGMYVLTAAQSYQAAQEAAKFGHGFLTYALVEEGLKQGDADREPKNGTIEMREWLDFATDEVPKMQLNNSREALRGSGRYVNFVGDGRELGLAKTEAAVVDNIQRPRVFYRRELEANPLVVATVGAASPR